jgi:hypothetical protein
MDEDALKCRLSRISTVWTLFDKVGRTDSAGVKDAHLLLFQRYQGAAYRYGIKIGPRAGQLVAKVAAEPPTRLVRAVLAGGLHPELNH